MLSLACRRARPSRALLQRGHAYAVTFSSSGPDSSRSLVALLEAHSAEQSALVSTSSSGKAPFEEPTVTVFALSHDVSDLAGVLSAIRRHHPNAIGCLSSPQAEGTSSLALAHFFDDATERFRLFRSKETGRASISVGHWRPLHELEADAAGESAAVAGGGSGIDEDRLRKAFEGGDWSGMWGDEAMAKAEGTQTATLEGLEDADVAAVTALVVLATPSSATPFVQQVADLCPQVPTTAGLLAPPTPFTTGLAHTLFWRGGEQVESGAIGVARLAVDGATSSQESWAVRSGWAGLEPVKEGEVLVVDSCQGNLLLSIEPGEGINPNPTRQLLSLLSAAHLPPLGKDKDFFLGFLEPKSSSSLGTASLRRVVRIMSGDPSRGGMALDCEDSLDKGDRVAFLHRPEGALAASSNEDRPLLSFSSPSPHVRSSPSTEGGRVEHGVFRAASEAGVLVGQTVERVAGSWVAVDKGRSR